MARQDCNRGVLIDRALAATAWVAGRRFPFRTDAFAEAVGVGVRNGWRWLDALEAAGAVEKAGPGLWRACGPTRPR